jgi:hypothetical protein
MAVFLIKADVFYQIESAVANHRKISVEVSPRNIQIHKIRAKFTRFFRIARAVDNIPTQVYNLRDSYCFACVMRDV